ncbi:MAG TPA: hypothetical protein VFI33_19445, partial [Puia sp.]|nr:hypothetical protein [Puia sp.]
TPIEQPVTEKDELDEETEEILEEKLNSEPVRSEETFQYAEPGSQTVTSFDELMAKYHLQPLDLVDETAKSPESSVAPEETAVESDRTHLAPQSDVESDQMTAAPETVVSPEAPVSSKEEYIQSEPEVARDFILPVAETDSVNTAISIGERESLEEVVNEYGIFEEIVTKKADQDMDAFDEPLDQIPFVSDKIIEGAPPVTQPEAIEVVTDTKQIEIDEDAANTTDNTAAENIGVDDYDTISENQESESEPHKTDEHDYDSFDRPLEDPMELESLVSENQDSNELPDYDPDNTGEPVEYSDESETGANGQMQELSERFEEHQKSLSAFNAKNADSIVFTPYHMVDYFASQGIKLVLEDNPPDQFGKQLKSFTDWLKVMKKLPLQHSPGKEDEKENEKIRHFAAHSIEERDVLTESMAEVLAKQGMYENAIALFQKLSLIYPPKSAYFASRIEQLKASLS